MKNIHKNLFDFILIIVLTALLGAGLISPQNAASQTNSQLTGLTNQINDLGKNLSGLSGQLNNLKGQVPSGNLGNQFNNLNGQINNLTAQYGSLANQLNGLNLNSAFGSINLDQLSNLSGQFSNISAQLGNLGGQLGNLGGQLGGSLGTQIGNLGGQLGNLGGQLGGLSGQMSGMSAGGGGGGGGGSGGGGSSNSVPVYETNSKMLEDIKTTAKKTTTTAEKTTDILKQMYKEWDFFRNNEKSKMEYFKKTQDKVQKYLQEDSEGNSRMIEDWIDFLSSPGLKAAKVFHEELEKNFLCETFNEQIKTMFKPEQRVKFSEKGAGGAGCTISDTVSDINAFYDDFSQGGWQAWNQLFEPQNNFFGAYILATEELATRQAIAKETSKLEGVANQGFISERTCLEEGPDGICLKSKITTPGYIFAEGLAKASFAELDYIVNSQDLEPYSKEIGNTFLDRMLKEIMGFLNMESSSAQPKKPPADDPCAFLKLIDIHLYEICKKLTASGNTIEESIKQSGVDYLKDILNEKNMSRNLNTATISMLNDLINVYNQTLALGCYTDPNQVLTTAARNLIASLQQENTRLSAEIAYLNKETAEIQAMTDTTEVISRTQKVKSLYDLKQAEDERRAAENTQNNIAGQLRAANHALTNCQQSGSLYR